MKKMQNVTLTQPVISVAMREQILGTHRRKQVGLFGGTFNPIHNGHLIMAEAAGTELGLEKVYFMPDNMPPHVDTKTAISARHLVNMVQLAIADNPLFGLEGIEIRRGGISYTYQTMQELHRLHPDTDYYFIIGADMVDYLPKWAHIDELVKLVTFVGVKRRGYTPASRYPILWVDAPLIDISSTAVRDRVQAGRSLKYLVPDPVIDYIQKEGLYRE